MKNRIVWILRLLGVGLAVFVFITTSNHEITTLEYILLLVVILPVEVGIFFVAEFLNKLGK